MNAVLKHGKLETIFDYDLTEEERNWLTLGLSEAEYLAITSQQGVTMGLVSLFGMRNNQEMINKYLARLDPDFVKTELNWDTLTRKMCRQ